MHASILKHFMSDGLHAHPRGSLGFPHTHPAAKADTQYEAPTQHRSATETRRSDAMTRTAKRTTAACSKRRQPARWRTAICFHVVAFYRDIYMYSHARACLSAHPLEAQRMLSTYTTVALLGDRPTNRPPESPTAVTPALAVCPQRHQHPIPATTAADAHDNHSARPPYQFATTAAAQVAAPRHHPHHPATRPRIEPVHSHAYSQIMR